MSDGMVRKWVRKYNEGHDNMHDEPQSGQCCLHRWPRSMRRGYRNWCPVVINALIMLETM